MSTRPARILVIDDDRYVRSTVTRALVAAGHDARAAADGAGGLQALHDWAPDVVLCDVLMPGLHGFDVLHALREMPHRAATQFVFLSVRYDRCDVRNGIAHGADDYVPKPFTSEELLDAVAAALRRRRRLAGGGGDHGPAARHPALDALLSVAEHVQPDDVATDPDAARALLSVVRAAADALRGAGRTAQ